MIRQWTDPVTTGALTMAMAFRTALAWTVLMLVASQRCAGQETAPSEEGAETFKLIKSYYRHKARQYEFTLDAQGEQKLVLQPVAMTFTGHDYQTVANTVSANSGELYGWT